MELTDGSNDRTGSHLGWYYVTIAVEGKIFGLVETGLNSDIARGEFENRKNFFVAGGLKDNEADFVFNNVGHSSASTLYKMDLSADVLERAQETLARRERFNEALEGMKTVENKSKTLENRLYDKLTELFPDFMSGKFSYLKLESPGFEPLSLEWIGAETISVMHTYTMNGDLMYDPMMTFWVDRTEGDETLRAESFEQSMPPLYQTRNSGGEWHSVDGNGNMKTFYIDRNVGTFAEQWFKNIAEQGFTPVIGTLVQNVDEEIRVTFDKDGNMIMLEDYTEPVITPVPKNDIGFGGTPLPVYDSETGYPAPTPPPKAQTEKQPTLDLSLPDPAWTVAEMNEYGYTETDMYPLSVGRAVELFDAGHTIYLLYDDNTEAMAFDRDEIITFSNDGFCGITKTDWEMSPIRDAQNKVYENVILNREQIESAKESDLIHSRENMFGIYQIRDDVSEVRNFRFTPMRELEALGLSVERDNYELVYSAPLMQRFLHGMLNDNDRTLETLYARFNDSLPSDYTARSMSVSDVVVLQQGGEVTAHFVDSAGFKELPSFTGNEREQPTLSQIDTRQTAKQTPPPQIPTSKAAPSLMDEINEAKQLVARGGQTSAKQNELEV